jgi:hypothetical protein
MAPSKILQENASLRAENVALKARVAELEAESAGHYRVAAKRGSLISGVTGIVVHDHWKPY